MIADNLEGKKVRLASKSSPQRDFWPDSSFTAPLYSGRTLRQLLLKKKKQ